MKAETRQLYKQRILDVLVHIQGHLDEALCLEDLARIAHFSPFHFHRIFRGMVGESVMEHVRRLRMERAAYRLRRSEDPVTRIAFEAGYETHEAFTRAFRAMFGTSPSGFREPEAAMPVGNAPSGVHYRPEKDLSDFVIVEPGGLLMEVRVEEMQKMRIASVRHVGPYAECGPAWEKLCGWAGPKGLLGPHSLFLGVCYDDPEVTAPESIRYDASISVGPGIEGEGDIRIQEIPGGRYAVATHHGPYARLHETWSALCGQWLPGSEYEIADTPTFEIYRNDPQSTPPEKLVTDLFLPLKS